ncbi:MAG TPA: hypothetical protein VIX19_11885 [Terriglobales bacterium]
MLFRPFRFRTWLKIGFIGWLAGESVKFNVHLPSFPGGESSGSNSTLDVRSWINEHMLLIAAILAVTIAVILAFVYLYCRFRFILFDSVLKRDVNIGRGWKRYASPAQRYFSFLISLLLIFSIVMAGVVGLPLWRAYKRGIFHLGDPLAIIRVVTPVILAVFVLGILGAIIAILAQDFGVPILALDDLTVSDAWTVLKQSVATEPWAYAGYLGMKLVLSVAAGIMAGIAGIFIFLILLIPGAIVGLGGYAIGQAVGPTAGVVLAVLGGLVVAALAALISMLLTAPLAVFFTSYSLYFFGGRYPRLGELLWPQPPAPVIPPTTPPPPGPPFIAPA